MTKAAALVLLFAMGCKDTKVTQGGERSKNDVARSAAKAIAYEAYPQWSIAHPDKQCPSSIADLASYADGSKMLDPWGNPFVFMCGPTMPPGEKGVLVVSAGEDGRSGTPDDIKSSDE